jgi:(p)ppGpp synthase/HD superfamily hydrolase
MVAMEVIAALEHEDGLDGDLAVQCALLHDVIEDAGKTHADIVAVFGEGVADGVQALSKDEKVGMGNDDRNERKRLRMLDFLLRIKKQPHEIGIVKLADRITNFQPPPKGWNDEKIKWYREEGKLILSELEYVSLYLSERLRGKLRLYPQQG